MHQTFSKLCLVFATAFTAACSSGSKAPDAGVKDAGPPVGFLSLAVAAPSGVPVSVVVKGPAGFSQALTQSTFLRVAPGSYSAEATPLSDGSSGTPILYTSTVTGSPATVQEGAVSELSVEYKSVLGTGKIWFSGFSSLSQNGALFGATPLASDPDAVVDFSAQIYPEAMALDREGGIWFADDNSSQVIKLSASQLTNGGFFVVPAVVLANGADGGTKADGGYILRQPESPAFDPQGNLWVADIGSNVLLKYSGVAAFAGRVVTEPTAILANNLDGGGLAPDGGRSFASPLGLAFDSAGNLWVSSRTADQITMYSAPSALTGLVAPDPAVILGNVNDGGVLAFDRPMGLAFDSQNNLWVANSGIGNPSIVKLTMGQRSVSDSVQPAAMLVDSAPDVPFRNTEYLAFDQAGNLWVGDNDRVLELQAAAVAAASGSTAIDAGWIFFYRNAYGGILVDPAPTNLPLYH